MRHQLIDISGQRFGKLIVLERMGSDKYHHSLWLCECDCGNRIVANKLSIQRGSRTNCSCQNDADKVLNLYNSGMSIRQIVRSTHHGRRLIRNALRSHNIMADPRRRGFDKPKRIRKPEPLKLNIRPRHSEDTIQQVVALYRQGLSGGQIKDKLGIKNAYSILYRQGVTLRSTQEGQKLRWKDCVPQSNSARLFLDEIEKKYGIAFEREYLIAGRFFDARYGDVLIEVDGGYYHRKGATRSNGDNEKVIELLKDYIARSRGYRLYRLRVDSVDDVDLALNKYTVVLDELFGSRLTLH